MKKPVTRWGWKIADFSRSLVLVRASPGGIEKPPVRSTKDDAQPCKAVSEKEHTRLKLHYDKYLDGFKVADIHYVSKFLMKVFMKISDLDLWPNQRQNN